MGFSLGFIVNCGAISLEPNALPVAEKDYWAFLAKQKNDEISQEVEFFRRKLQAYEKRGPLGSMDRHAVVDIQELSQLLNCPGSNLAEMWKMDNIYPWVLSVLAP